LPALLSLFVFLISFDSLIRAAIFRLALPQVFYGWKEAVFGLLMGWYLLAIWKARGVQAAVDRPVARAFGAVVASGLISAAFALGRGADAGQVAWGLKVLYYYMPLFLFVWFPPVQWAETVAAN
jgi:hypothetical protein